MRDSLLGKVAGFALALYAALAAAAFIAFQLLVLQEPGWAEELRDLGRCVYISVLLFCLLHTACGAARRLTGKDDLLEDEQTESSSA